MAEVVDISPVIQLLQAHKNYIINPLTNAKSITPTVCSVELSYNKPIFPHPNQLRARYKTARDSLYAPKPAGMIQTSQF